MWEDFKDNPGRYLKSLAMDIAVAVVGVAYIFYQMVKLEPTNVNPITLIASAIISIICGIIIKQALGENGFTKGYNSKEWMEEEAKYNASCNDLIQYLPLVNNYYLYQEAERRANTRRMILQGKRLRYQDWFDKEGNYIGTKEAYKQLDFVQKIAMQKAIRLKVHVLNLFSEYASSYSGAKDKEITDRGQRVRNLSKNTISAILVSVIGVYFVPVLTGWNWATMISSTMSVALWVLFGMMQYYSNYNFVVHDRVNLLKKKKEDMAVFEKGSKEHRYDHPPFWKPEDDIAVITSPIETSSLAEEMSKKIFDNEITLHKQKMALGGE